METTNPHFERAWILVQRGNYELAEKELRHALVSQPNSGWPHALLALCLTHRERHQEANAEAEAAIGLAPDDSFSHYIRSIVLTNANCLPEAKAAAEHAIELDTAAPHHYAQLSLVLFRQQRWSDALQVAEQGLQVDPEHDGCVNLRTMALVKLGRRDAAAESLQGALERDPDDAWTHANMGWTLIEQGQHAKALEHFREALRLEPGLEMAREGIVTAMKARHFIYRPLFSYFLWVQKLGERLSWALFIGSYLCIRFLFGLKEDHPEWSGAIMALIILYMAFAFSTWLADPLFNLSLRLNRFGRLALDDEQRRTSTLVGVCVAVAILALAMYFFLQQPLLLWAAMAWMIAILPLSLIYKAEEGWPRYAVLGMALVLVAIGILPMLFVGLDGILPRPLHAILALFTLLGMKCFTIAAIGSQIASQIIVSRTPRRVTLRGI